MKLFGILPDYPFMWHLYSTAIGIVVPEPNVHGYLWCLWKGKVREDIFCWRMVSLLHQYHFDFQEHPILVDYPSNYLIIHRSLCRSVLLHEPCNTAHSCSFHVCPWFSENLFPTRVIKCLCQLVSRKIPSSPPLGSPLLTVGYKHKLHSIMGTYSMRYHNVYANRLEMTDVNVFLRVDPDWKFGKDL